MKKKFYTYIHTRNDTGLIFYVGKGSAQRAYSRYNRNNLWHKIVKKHGYTVQILSYWQTEQEAFEEEKKLIKKYRDSGINLANFTDGGDGVTGYRHTKEVKEKASERTKQFWMNQENAKKMIEIRKKQWTEEARKKASDSSKEVWTEEMRKRHSESLRIAYSSKERKAMQANRNKKFRESAEGRAAMSEVSKRYWLSEASQTEEAKRKRSEARKKSWETRRKQNALN